MESFTEEQEKALQLLTSLQNLIFYACEGLQSLPQGLHRLSSLKELHIIGCSKIRSMPKEGLPVSLRKLEMNWRSAEIDEQIEKIKEPTHIYPSKNNYTQGNTCRLPIFIVFLFLPNINLSNLTD